MRRSWVLLNLSLAPEARLVGSLRGLAKLFIGGVGGALFGLPTFSPHLPCPLPLLGESLPTVSLRWWRAACAAARVGPEGDKYAGEPLPPGELKVFLLLPPGQPGVSPIEDFLTPFGTLPEPREGEGKKYLIRTVKDEVEGPWDRHIGPFEGASYNFWPATLLQRTLQARPHLTTIAPGAPVWGAEFPSWGQGLGPQLGGGAAEYPRADISSRGGPFSLRPGSWGPAPHRPGVAPIRPAKLRLFEETGFFGLKPGTHPAPPDVEASSELYTYPTAHPRGPSHIYPCPTFIYGPIKPSLASNPVLPHLTIESGPYIPGPHFYYRWRLLHH